MIKYMEFKTKDIVNIVLIGITIISLLLYFYERNNMIINTIDISKQKEKEYLDSIESNNKKIYDYEQSFVLLNEYIAKQKLEISTLKYEQVKIRLEYDKKIIEFNNMSYDEHYSFITNYLNKR